MRPDDAADLLTRLPGPPFGVLETLPAEIQAKIRRLLGHNHDSAGGLMTPDLLALPPDISMEAAIARVRDATTISAEVLLSVYVVDATRLVGVVGCPTLIQADPAAPLGQVADPDPVRVSADAHITEVAVRLTDFNLVTLPVVDADDHLIGVITVDDVLETTVPEEWWNRVEDVERSPQTTAARQAHQPAQCLTSRTGGCATLQSCGRQGERV